MIEANTELTAMLAGLAGGVMAWCVLVLLNMKLGNKWPLGMKPKKRPEPERSQPVTGGCSEAERREMIEIMEKMAREQVHCFACQHEKQYASCAPCSTCYDGENFVSKYRRDK